MHSLSQLWDWIYSRNVLADLGQPGPESELWAAAAHFTENQYWMLSNFYMILKLQIEFQV